MPQSSNYCPLISSTTLYTTHKDIGSDGNTTKKSYSYKRGDYLASSSTAISVDLCKLINKRSKLTSHSLLPLVPKKELHRTQILTGDEDLQSHVSALTTAYLKTRNIQYNRISKQTVISYLDKCMWNNTTCKSS